MSVVDLILALAFIVAALLGARQGFITPALTTVGFISLPVLFLSQPELRRSIEGGPAAPIVVIAPIVVGIVAAIIGMRIARRVRRHRAARLVDGALGLVLYLVAAGLLTYVVLGFMIALDIGLTPIHRLTAVGPGDVTRLDASLSANPIAPVFVDPKDLGGLGEAARVRPVPIDQIGQYHRTFGFYELMVRPQLTASRIAPLLVTVGSQIQLGKQVLPMPQALPRDQPPAN